MFDRERIGQLFVALGQTGALDVALADGVRAACEASGCSAGALVAAGAASDATQYWHCYDPRGLLGSPACECWTATVDLAEPPCSRGAELSSGVPREVRVPLSCAGQDVGWLSLWAPPHVDEQHLQRQIEGIRAALAMLMAAAENAAARPLSGVLGRAAFRSRVVSELARSQRHEEEFSVLHVRLAGARPPKGNPASGPWVAAAALGETLVDHLRRSDVVGLMGPDRLAVLLTATGRLGARIAARRVAELVSGCADNQGGCSGFGSAALECCLRTFPDNAADVESLCRATDWYVEAARRPAVSGVRP